MAGTLIAPRNGWHPYRLAPDTFEGIIGERLATFDEPKRELIREQILPLYDSPAELRQSVYGEELAGINLREVESVELCAQALSGVDIRRGLLGLWAPPAELSIPEADLEQFQEHQTEIFSPHNITSIDAISGAGRAPGQIGLDLDNTESQSIAFEPQAVTDALGLYIRRVKCVKETEPAWWGSDEIALAGVSVDENGDTKRIAEAPIASGFDDGDTKWYSPNRQWHWFSLREGGNTWPKSYLLTFILAEKDMGGLSAFVQKMWLRVKNHVVSAVTKFASASLGALGRIIGYVVNYVLDKIFQWFRQWWEDDIFPHKTVSCTVPSYDARWTRNGKWGYPTSENRRVHFYGHGGHYYLEYFWRLFS